MGDLLIAILILVLGIIPLFFGIRFLVKKKSTLWGIVLTVIGLAIIIFIIYMFIKAFTPTMTY